MKKITILIASFSLLFIQLLFSQKKQDKTIHVESGINISVPVHIEMYRTHRLGIGINAKISERISEKLELGIRADYDYRFTNRHNHDTIKVDASRKNFGIISIKPGVQFNLKSKWFWGAETGLGYAISDENNRIGLGFVSEYRGEAQFGSCSSLYLGKYIRRHLGFSLNFTNFVAKAHAENTLGIKINYYFNR